MTHGEHSRYEHFYVVIRIDDYQTGAIERRISPVSVFRDPDRAEAETDRLNELTREKDVHYVMFTSRLKG